MPRFEDYHRTVIGYHGTRLPLALEIVQGARSFDSSRNDHDWLGHGVYFWEYAPKQAWWWAERLRRRNGWEGETAVLASMIRLGNCFDLVDPDNARELAEFGEEYLAVERLAGRVPPANMRQFKRLDCAVWQYAYANIEERGESIDSARAVYVPTQDRARLFPHSWMYGQTHLQLCVRNPDCILGTWPVRPTVENRDDRPAGTPLESPDVGQDSEGAEGTPGDVSPG